jgi:Flavoprotein
VLVLPPGARPDRTTSRQLAAAVDGPVSGFWSTQTGGRVRFRTVRAVGWLRVRSRCDDAWGLWSEVGVRVGFVPGPRRHLLVLVPPSAGGCYAGLGTIGVTSDAGGYAYVRGTLTGLVAHEFGHNMGLGHSNGLQCAAASDGVWSGSWTAGCLRTGYRDWYDVMGVSWDHLGTLSTAQAYRLGAIGPGEVVTVAGPARVTLSAAGLHQGLQSVRITDPGGGVYVVEYRAAVGDDTWLARNWRDLRPGVLVRRDDPESDPTQTLLLDASPSSAARFAADWDEPAPVGGALTTGDGRVVVRVERETGTTAESMPELVRHAQATQWAVCVIGTRMGMRFLDASMLRELTGHPVRDEYKQPDDPDVLPAADAFVVAPCTFNTNKLAAGISDTLALGVLNEAIGPLLQSSSPRGRTTGLLSTPPFLGTWSSCATQVSGSFCRVIDCLPRAPAAPAPRRFLGRRSTASSRLCAPPSIHTPPRSSWVARTAWSTSVLSACRASLR